MLYHCKPQGGTVDLGVEMAMFPPPHILLHSPCLLFVHFLSHFCQIKFAQLQRCPLNPLVLKQKSSHTHNDHVSVMCWFLRSHIFRTVAVLRTLAVVRLASNLNKSLLRWLLELCQRNLEPQNAIPTYTVNLFLTLYVSNTDLNNKCL